VARGNFLDDYEPVEDRLARFWKDHPQGRVHTWPERISEGFDACVFGAWLEAEDGRRLATGFAYEHMTPSGVNKTSHVENCETSAIGRALANAGYAPKGKRPSREEMWKTVELPAPTLPLATPEELQYVRDLAKQAGVTDRIETAIAGQAGGVSAAWVAKASETLLRQLADGVPA